MTALIVFGIIIGISNLVVVALVLHRLMKVEKTVNKNRKILIENKSNIEKIVKILDIVMKRTKAKPLNLN
jgi:hypothetical protein